MLNRPASAERNQALEQLRGFIDAGGYLPGDRLPAERELIDSLGLSRNALRKGLDALEREGAIWRHVGKGTFIAANDGVGGMPGLGELSRQVTPVQMMRARLSLEPAIAREAAANASAESIVHLRAARDRALAATDWDAYEAQDDAFHRSIAEATGNVLLCSLFDHLNQVRRAVAWRQVIRKTERPPRTHPSFEEHDQIVSAIEARAPTDAHAAMREHLGSVSRRLFGDV
ncbi:MAG: FCD domain-containing protein [Granulosicoccus sp.]|nr:FCD domain-containing protein [Granulosicoccus sp.]